MLFCDQINNYEDFKSRFGYKTGQDGRYLANANGVKQRKNNVVYLFWKEDAKYLRKRGHSLSEAFELAQKFDSSKELFQYMLQSTFGTHTSDICPVTNFDDFEILNYGICADGDVNSIRYQKRGTNKVYKMKIGKYVGKFLDSIQKRSDHPWLSNQTLRIFFIEELTELWKNKRLKEQSLKVVVDKDFHAIYDTHRRPADSSCFNSCMDNDPNWNFYKNHEDIFDAISLQDEDGMIYARAILVHCYDTHDNPHTYMERIYCNKRMFKDLLFEKAKLQNIFDLYKGLEASCHDSLEVYKVSDSKRITDNLYIPLNLKTGDFISFQDTFKFYYRAQKKAYNQKQLSLGTEIGLATTEVHLRY